MRDTCQHYLKNIILPQERVILRNWDFDTDDLSQVTLHFHYQLTKTSVESISTVVY